MQRKSKELEPNSSESEATENEPENQEMDVDDDENDAEAGPSGSESAEASAKKKKRGIIYISSIPKYMNVTILREMLSQYAKIGRIFLQPGKLTSKMNNENWTNELSF